MIIAAPTDYRLAAQRRLPRFLFDYIDGGANAEQTLRANTADLQQVCLRQRVLRTVAEVDLSARLCGQSYAMPVVLAPVGLTGMYARRGEVQAARAATAAQVPYTLSTVSVCTMEEVAGRSDMPPWFQLYVLKDRQFMRHALQRARDLGVQTLVFTVDMPVPGSRYRDPHSGMSGPNAAWRRVGQALTHPRWAWDVGLRGRPHDLGNISRYLGKAVGLQDYIGWLGANFDPAICWDDLQWLRDEWRGGLIIKGILDAEDARSAVRLGADGIVVSNHGGRQLDGVLSTTKALPPIAAAVKGQTTVLVDSGVRSGLDVVRMLALGADAVMIGRAYIYALAAAGESGVSTLLALFAKEMRVAMALTGVTRVDQLTSECLIQQPEV